MKITYCEDTKGQYFAFTDNDRISEEIYPKQVEFENVPDSEFEYLMDMDTPTEEIKEKIKKIIQAHYE